MEYNETPNAWKMDGLELSVEQKLNDVYNIASGAAAASLPAVSSTDNGKTLLVKSGKWQKAAIPSQLPSVTADDNGDILTVVEGAWAKATPSGGGTDFYSVFALLGDYADGDTIDSETMSLLIDAFYNDGRPAVMTVNFEDASSNLVYGIFADYPSMNSWYCFAGDLTAIGSTLVVDTDASSETYGKITVTLNQP